MKTILLMLVMLVAGCGQVTKPDTKKPIAGKNWKIPLKNGLGTVEIGLPDRYDTLFTWTELCDDAACTKIKYRIQPKANPIFVEDDHKIPSPDSVDQFTVQHLKFTHNAISDFSSTGVQNLREALYNYNYDLRNTRYLTDTVLTVNNVKVAVISARSYSSDYTFFRFYNYPVYREIVRAVTYVQGNVILLSFEYSNRFAYSKNQEFIPKALNYLKTLKVITRN